MFKQMLNVLGKKIITTDLCSITNKLKFENMHQNQAHLSFAVSVTLAGIKISCNTARQNILVRM
jgi:hypothetical protein